MKQNQKFKQNQVRIIGGAWRGRKIVFPDIQSLRPTPDRIRETLFNWLMPYIQGARCLDLFAGSGALGFEAASRGAENVVLIDNNIEVIKCLQRNCDKLDANNIDIIQVEMPTSDIHFSKKPFDIVFLDPPFASDLLVSTFQWLEKSELLKSGSLIYIEKARDKKDLQLPPGWQTLKTKKTKSINYFLIQIAEQSINGLFK
jgi:16S rRNA (guanine966-N2)-methyltransferase